ncbi:hypothetical protein [Streptomyces sp. LN500]|uniref:hypothetical protein n=1 Tax=Streptomyces sp. LN500 TaxID=3112978 RepID=UPI003717F707
MGGADAPPDSETPARSKMAIDRLIARRNVHLREKTLWRMLYETAARSEEILGINIEELDLAGRGAPVKAKGAQPRIRRRGAVREDFVLEPVYWDAGTARLVPRLLKGRTRGPVFVTHRRPGPEKVVSPREPCARTPGWSVVRAGPHAAGRAHRATGRQPQGYLPGLTRHIYAEMVRLQCAGSGPMPHGDDASAGGLVAYACICRYTRGRIGGC